MSAGVAEPNSLASVGIGNDGATSSQELGDFKVSEPHSQVSMGKGDDGDVEVEEKQISRQKWDNPWEFLLSCIALSVGLGNVWRFPYTAYENGGGAFIIPYLLVLGFIAKPLYFLDLCIGQFSSKGQVLVWNMVPFLKGVGYASAFATGCVISYYCALMALTIFYFIGSFQTELPWSVCNPEWEREPHNVKCIGGKAVGGQNRSIPELYFRIDVLHDKEQINDGLGWPDWRLSLCLLASWLAVYGSLIKGVKSAGKAAYFTALFPYVVLFILLIRGLTLDGAGDGIRYFIEPQWGKLLEGKVWAAAVGQCFFSLSVGFGPIIMSASYNEFSHNIYRDAWIISFADTFTSLLAGFTIFGILGNLAKTLNVPLKNVAGGGAALAFSTYPLAITQFKISVVPQLLSVLFFLMLFTLGVGSASALTGSIITIIEDKYPTFNKTALTTTVCIVGFLTGLIYVTPGGQWMLELVDLFGSSFVVYITALVEIVGISWIYGLDNLCRDIEFMLGDKLGKSGKVGWYWKFCWGILIPVVLFTIVLISMYNMKGGVYYEGKEFPTGALVFGVLLALFAIMLIPINGIQSLFSMKSNTYAEKLREAFQPTSEWGPDDPSLRSEWLAFCAERDQQGGNIFTHFTKSVMKFFKKGEVKRNEEVPEVASEVASEVVPESPTENLT